MLLDTRWLSVDASEAISTVYIDSVRETRACRNWLKELKHSAHSVWYVTNDGQWLLFCAFTILTSELKPVDGLFLCRPGTQGTASEGEKDV